MNKVDLDHMKANGAAMDDDNSPGQHEPHGKSDFFRADKISTSRATIFYALGVVGGLILGGIGLFNARGTTTNTVPPEDLALVNQVPILRSDFINQLESETGEKFDEASRKEKLKVLDEMLREELLVQRGLELNFAETDQASRNALVSSVEQQAIAEVTTSQPTEKQLKKKYENERARYATEGTMTVHNLMVLESLDKDDAKERGGAAAAALRQGMPLLEVEQRYGLVMNKFYDEDFYFAAKIHLGDKIYEQVVNMKPGGITDPILWEGNYHVVQMLNNTRPVPLSYARARAQVLTDYKNTVSFLRNRSKILIAKDYAGDYNPHDFKDSYGP
jgi:hypothetical protein